MEFTGFCSGCCYNYWIPSLLGSLSPTPLCAVESMVSGAVELGSPGGCCRASVAPCKSGFLLVIWGTLTLDL